MGDQPLRTTSRQTARSADLSSERSAWKLIGEGWRPLFGHYHDLGFSFEWHDFNLTQPLDWAPSFHSDSLELCLNLSGDASLDCPAATARFSALTAGFYFVGKDGDIQAVRQPGLRHRFLTVELSREFLRTRLESWRRELHPLVRTALEAGPAQAGAGPVEPLTPGQVELVNSLRQPPVGTQAQRLWFEGKACELMAHLLFRQESEEFFCTRQFRVARERTTKVVEILKRDLANPPALDEIGREIGCSPHYLSRTFSSQMGVTIPQHLRKLRMEQAAALLASGQRNVTEAALEVGYSSLSHFSTAFRKIYGCCPGLYPIQHSAMPEEDFP